MALFSEATKTRSIHTYISSLYFHNYFQIIDKMTDLVAAAASRIMPGNAVTMTVSALTATAIGYYAYARSGHLFSLSYFSKKM